MINWNAEMGRYFGYPQCCIDAFDEIISNSGRRTPEQSYVAATGTGFIPCPNHAKQIVEGKITLASLIKNRICPLPFPLEPGIEVIDEYLVESNLGVIDSNR